MIFGIGIHFNAYSYFDKYDLFENFTFNPSLLLVKEPKACPTVKIEFCTEGFDVECCDSNDCQGKKVCCHSGCIIKCTEPERDGESYPMNMDDNMCGRLKATFKPKNCTSS